MRYRNDAPTAGFDHDTALIAIELSGRSWLVGVLSPGARRMGRHRLAAGDVDRLVALGARELAGGAGKVVCLYEAGRDGFWLQRTLAGHGLECLVVDPASVEVTRRKRRAKTDRLDLEGLMRVLARWLGGDAGICRMVMVPSPVDEDLRRTARERRALVGERVRHTNRIKAQLALIGVRDYDPLAPGARAALAGLRGAGGDAVPAAMRRQIEREFDRLELVVAQIAAVEAERDEAVRRPAAEDAQAERIAALVRFKAIGIETATVLGREVFFRSFDNRRRVAGYVGLCSSPWASGDSSYELGISKAGNARARAAMIELAWRWLRWQPDSALSQWFHQRVGAAHGRVRRIAIVALARKLLVALWRYLETGLVPEGAVMK